MPVIDSTTRKMRHDYTIEELYVKAREIRVVCMRALAAAGTLCPERLVSHIDMATLLYFKYLRHDPAYPGWEDRDRIYWSLGFPELTIRIVLAMAGYLSIEEALASAEGTTVNGMELMARSYGSTLGIAAGDAFRAGIDGKGYQVFSLMGEADQRDGGLWEAAHFAAANQLANLVGIVFRSEYMNGEKALKGHKVELLADKYASFGWHVILAQGNNLQELIEALSSIKTDDIYPTVIIAGTPAGGSDFSREAEQARDQGKGALNSTSGRGGDFHRYPSRQLKYCWNGTGMMKVTIEDPSHGIEAAVGGLDRSRDIVMLTTEMDLPVLNDTPCRDSVDGKIIHVKFGMTVENMCAVAAGLAKAGKFPFISLLGKKGTGSCWEQIRTNICRNNLNVKIIDLSEVGREDMSLLYFVPEIRLEVPCDALEMEKALRAVSEQQGPALVRGSSHAVPIVSTSESCFRTGVANVIRYRKQEKKFAQAFEIMEGWGYTSEDEDICIIAIGSMVGESMRAAYVLKEEYGIDARIVNPHTLKPIDENTILRAAAEVAYLLTVEDHYIGGFGNIIAGILTAADTRKTPFVLRMAGIEEGGKREDITAEYIIKKALDLIEVKQQR